MNTSELRTVFLDYFAEHGHQIVPSAPLVPGNDPTLLFTNAGMVQFKDVFLGSDSRDYARAASSQRCVRAGGKHNDLENVGYTARHHTFFEMLGNFSFGDYFKREAIQFAWEFLTQRLEIPGELLWVTVFEDDDEAADIWLNEIGIDPARFSRLGEKDNFWSMGETGPCGPCSEIFYDHGADVPGGPPGSADGDADRYVEIWNLVFMQFDRDAGGALNPLPKPSVDTGMGLERIAAVMQGVHSNYEIDLFANLIRDAAAITGATDLESSSLRVIADHIRACAFLIVDGVLPGNEGRGYVLRRIIRRALGHGSELGVSEPFFHKLVWPLAEEMGQAYPELTEQAKFIEGVLFREEEQFSQTLARGKRIFDSETSLDSLVMRWHVKDWPNGCERNVRVMPGGNFYEFSASYKTSAGDILVEIIEQSSLIRENFSESIDKFSAVSDKYIKLELVIVQEDEHENVPDVYQTMADTSEQNVKVLNVSTTKLESYKRLRDEIVFSLYDTYGFPLDMTVDLARKIGYRVDVVGFEKLMQVQKDRARRSQKFKVEQDGSVRIDAVSLFVGYDKLVDSGEIIQLLKGNEKAGELAPGDSGIIVLDRTPFYAESGGQVGDQGQIRGADGFVFKVTDTQKSGAAYLHIGEVESGRVTIGMSVDAVLDPAARAATVLNHSATHLLHAALREILGDHIAQKGSLVTQARLRFDFSHYEPCTADQLRQIEALVNDQIRANAEVTTTLMSYDEALDAGAMALFGEKYSDQVRVLRIGDFSTELCGGTHAARAGDIGLFKITAETGVASGVRRIEAVTGAAATARVAEVEQVLGSVAALLKAGNTEIEAKVQQLLSRGKSLERENEQLTARLADGAGRNPAADATEIAGIRVLVNRLDDGVGPKALREAVDRMKDKLGTAVVVLGSATGDGKVRLAAGVTKDVMGRIKAGDLVNAVARQVGGKGGGRADFAQAGGSDAAALNDALASVPEWVQQQLG